MKKLFAILTLASLTFSSFAQFVPGPHAAPALACPSTGFLLGHAYTLATNVATLGLAPSFSLNGDRTVCLYMDWQATNNTTGDSNIVAYFQYSVDGVKWMGPAAVSGFSPILGTPIPGPKGRNQSIIPLLSSPGSLGGVLAPSLLTITNMSAVRYIRLYQLSNQCVAAGNDGASNTYYITNMYFIQREN